jgi:hypothetical protein
VPVDIEHSKAQNEYGHERRIGMLGLARLEAALL